MEKPYTWFSPEATRELKARLNAAGDDAILKVHRTGSSMELEVGGAITPQVHTSNHINDSHVCPPDCPPR